MDADADWYAVRCVFRWTGWEGTPFDERITLWRAESLANAIELAEAEAGEYARANDLDYAGLAQAYQLASDIEPGNGIEVFSLLRDSDLPATEYLTTFFDTGHERQTTGGD